MKKKYTHIFFDLDNTLWDFKTNSRLAMQITFEQLNMGNQNVDFNNFFEIYSKHNHSLWEDYRNKKVNKKDLIRRRFQDTFTELGIKGIDTEKINTLYFNEMPKQKALYNNVFEILKYLKDKRYKMFIITNGFKEVQFNKIQNSGLEPFFNKIFTSEEIKVPKPGREIFEHAIKSTNAKKSESIMIGDDWDVDIMGAINFEIDAVYFSQKNHGIKTYKSKVFYISKLMDLTEIL